MLARHMFGYLPSLIIPALTAFASVFFFTRLMQPDDYGHYVLALNAMTMLLGVGFLWLQSAVSRLLPQETARGNEDKFTATLYMLFILCSIGLLIVATAIIIDLPLGDWSVAAWCAPPLAICRALLNINQAYHRYDVKIARYNIIEVGQSVLGLSSALFFVWAFEAGAGGAAIGGLVGLFAFCLFDWRMLVRIKWRDFDWSMWREITQFGLPFIINYGLSFVLSRSDSFLIQIFRNATEVGIYNAGYAFPDRVAQYLFMAVATASLPLTVRRLEQEGTEAAREQTYINGVAILALAVPACVGMLFINPLIVDVLIGEDFRAGALAIIPWITVASIMNGLAAHYFDHAFHLAKKTRLFFLTLGPSAAFNFIANLFVIPRYGAIGAAWTTCAAYALYLALSIIIGRRIFAVHFPFKPALHIALATAIMALGLWLSTFPDNAWGLLAMIVTGGFLYGIGVLLFDIMGVRALIVRKLGLQKKITGARAQPRPDIEILTTFADIETIAADWQALHHRAGRSIFGSYEWFQIWWRHWGGDDAVKLYVLVKRAANGTVTALLPLAVRWAGLARIAEWLGYEMFDYGDILADNAQDADDLWRYALTNGAFDIALIKDVHRDACCRAALDAHLTIRAQRRNYFLTLDFKSGEAWLTAQSRKLRGDLRRKMEKMQTKGAVAFDVHQVGGAVRTDVIDALCRQKTAWVKARFGQGPFMQEPIHDFIYDLAQHCSRDGSLYLSWLSCGGVIVACHMGFVRRGVLHLYLTTYDNDFGAYSPGNAIMAETIKWAVDQRLSELDFMRGDESYKQRFASAARDLLDYVAGRGVFGQTILTLRTMLENLRKRAKDSDYADQ